MTEPDPKTPVSSDAVAKVPTTIRLDEDIRVKLRAVADERGASESDLIRQAIVFYLGWLHGNEKSPPPR
jgi:hypothetical protein